MLQLIVPAFFQTSDLLDLLAAPRLHGVELLLARGRREPLASTSLEELLCRELGIARQQDWPIAPLSLAAAGGAAGKDYWLRADPVHLRFERDQLVLSEIAEPTPDEAEQLCKALAEHFGEDFSPQPLRPGAWVVRAEPAPQLVTIPLSQATGKPVDPLLPTGDDALPWRKLLNEVQMLLFSHPVNQAREARGEPAINSVWLWGGGRLPEMNTTTQRSVLCSDADWQALAKHAWADVRMLPAQWNRDIPDQALLIMEGPHRLLRTGDYNGWLQALRDFENNWLQPLLASGRPFRLDDPVQGMSLHWRRGYRWKFWLRLQKPVQQTFKLSPPPSDAGVDAFGKRY